ncbi:MAG: VanZ family protein [Eubacterium sp.]|nr:VanZ family protein [Eubacterium sp.]
MAAWLLFGLYLILMVYFLFFAESMGRTSMGQEYHYNLMPLKEIRRYITYYDVIGPFTVFLNLAGNILAFVPFGLFFPLLSRKNRGFFKVTLISFEVSLLVELIQLVTRVGSCDVDDMILNTLGGMLGYFCFKILFLWHRMELKGAGDEEKSTG